MTNLRHAAAALRYRDGMRAPVLVAKGKGLVAEEIIRRAKAAGIYVHESSELVGLLMQIDLDERIPPELYRATAEVLVWAYRIAHGRDRLPSFIGDDPWESAAH